MSFIFSSTQRVQYIFLILWVRSCDSERNLTCTSPCGEQGICLKLLGSLDPGLNGLDFLTFMTLRCQSCNPNPYLEAMWFDSVFWIHSVWNLNWQENSFLGNSPAWWEAMEELEVPICVLLLIFHFTLSGFGQAFQPPGSLHFLSFVIWK